MPNVISFLLLFFGSSARRRPSWQLEIALTRARGRSRTRCRRRRRRRHYRRRYRRRISAIRYTTAPTPPLSRNGESRRTRGAVIEYVISASFDGSEIYRSARALIPNLQCELQLCRRVARVRASTLPLCRAAPLEVAAREDAYITQTRSDHFRFAT